MKMRLVIVGVLLVACGCTTLFRSSEYTIRDLRRIHAACRKYGTDHGVLPARLDDLKDYLGTPGWLAHYVLVAKNQRWDELQTSADRPVARRKRKDLDGDYAVIFGDGRCGTSKLIVK